MKFQKNLFPTNTKSSRKENSTVHETIQNEVRNYIFKIDYVTVQHYFYAIITLLIIVINISAMHSTH